MEKEKTFENFTEHCFSSRLIDRLTEDIERLKKQLDKEIHYNRIMKRALEQIASENDSYLTIADKVLKEIDNKE